MKKLDELIELAKNEPIAEVPFSDEELLTMLEGPAQSATGSTSLISKYSKGALIMISGIISLTALLLLTNPQQSDLQDKNADTEVLKPAADRPLKGDEKNELGNKRKLENKHTKSQEQMSSPGSGQSDSGVPNSNSPENDQPMLTSASNPNSKTAPNPNSGSASASASATAQIKVTKTINGLATLELTDEELKALDIFRDGDTYKYPMDVLPRKLKDIPKSIDPKLYEDRKRFAIERSPNDLLNLGNGGTEIIFNNGEDDNPTPPVEKYLYKTKNIQFKDNISVVVLDSLNGSNPDQVIGALNMDSLSSQLKILINNIHADSVEGNDVSKENIDSILNSVKHQLKVNFGDNHGYEFDSTANTPSMRAVIQINEDARQDKKISKMTTQTTIRRYDTLTNVDKSVDMRWTIYDDTMEEGKIWREWDQLTLNRNGFTRRYPNPTKEKLDISETCAPFMASTRVFYTDKTPNGSYAMKQYSESYLNGNAPELVANGELPSGNVAEFLNRTGVKIVPIRIKLGNRSTTDSTKMLYADADLWYVVDKKFVEKLPERYREPLMKELEIAEMVGDGSLAPQEACDRLEGEKSYLDICRAGSANIKDVKAYPQPVSSGALNVEFNLAGNETVRAELYSVDGNYIATLAQPTQMKAGKQIMQTNIQGIENGVYLLALKTELGEEVVTKIIVNK